MRSVFVQRKVLELYQNMDSVSYPIQPELLLQCIPKSCRILSYQEMAEVTGCTVQDVAVLCKSNSGATHYDPDTNRYLILSYNFPLYRIRNAYVFPQPSHALFHTVLSEQVLPPFRIPVNWKVFLQFLCPFSFFLSCVLSSCCSFKIQDFMWHSIHRSNIKCLS